MSALCLDGWKDQIYNYFDKITNFTFDPETSKFPTRLRLTYIKVSGQPVKIEAGSLHVIHSVTSDLRAELTEMVRQAEGDEGLKGVYQDL